MRDPYHLKRYNYANFDNKHKKKDAADTGSVSSASSSPTEGDDAPGNNKGHSREQEEEGSRHHHHHHHSNRGKSHTPTQGHGSILKYTEENLYAFFDSFFDGSLPRSVATEPVEPEEEHGRQASGDGDPDDELPKKKLLPQSYITKVVAQNFNGKYVSSIARAMLLSEALNCTHAVF
jgi:hypothetical protein